MLPVVVRSAKSLTIVWVQPVAATAPADDLINIQGTPTLYLGHKVYCYTFVLISFQDLFPDPRTNIQLCPTLSAHGIKPARPPQRTRALHW